MGEGTAEISEGVKVEKRVVKFLEFDPKDLAPYLPGWGVETHTDGFRFTHIRVRDFNVGL